MPKQCLFCGNTFEKKYSESKKYWETKKFCSQACSLKTTSIRLQDNCYSIPVGTIPWNKDRKYDDRMKSRLDMSGLEKGRGLFKGKRRPEFSGVNHPTWQPALSVQCEYCGKMFERKLWQMKEHFYCDLACSRAGIRGKSSPVFKGEDAKNRLRQRIMQFPEYVAWRKAVFTRDGFKCVWCEKTSGFEADHIKPFAQIIKEHSIKTTDDARRCNALWDVGNGRTLCRMCHRKTDNYPKNLIKI
jgi:ribosomal protein L44E